MKYLSLMTLAFVLGFASTPVKAYEEPIEEVTITKPCQEVVAEDGTVTEVCPEAATTEEAADAAEGHADEAHESTGHESTMDEHSAE